MLLAVVIAFIILYIPSAIANIVAALMGENLFKADHLPIMHLYITCSLVKLLLIINSSANFLLYIIWGRTFRNRLIKMLCPKCAKLRSCIVKYLPCFEKSGGTVAISNMAADFKQRDERRFESNSSSNRTDVSVVTPP